jgi:hypothetical protein
MEARPGHPGGGEAGVGELGRGDLPGDSVVPLSQGDDPIGEDPVGLPGDQGRARPARLWRFTSADSPTLNDCRSERIRSFAPSAVPEIRTGRVATTALPNRSVPETRRV